MQMPPLVDARDAGDAVSQFNTLLFKYQKQHKWQEAVSTLEQLVQQGHVPPLMSFNAVIGTCGKAQRMEQAHRVFTYMMRLGVQPDVFTT